MNANDADISKWKALAREAAANQGLIRLRNQLARFTAEVFNSVGKELQVIGHIFGPDRVNGASPGGHGNDEVVAVSLLLRIAGQLTSASADLFADGRHYAAAALLRQIVEIEYLAWAFQARDSDAQRWLRSSRDERLSFFSPAKLRQASEGKFRGKDYGHHCELGGHPVPDAYILFQESTEYSQLLLSDLLGHTGRIWDSLIDWGEKTPWSAPISKRCEEMFLRYTEWKKLDGLNLLPPSP